MMSAHPQSIVYLHIGMFSAALEDLGAVIPSIKLHNQSRFVFLEVVDACMKP